MREGLIVSLIVALGFFAFGFGFALGIGTLMRSRTERVIAICVEKNIEPQKCVAIGDAIYGD